MAERLNRSVQKPITRFGESFDFVRTQMVPIDGPNEKFKRLAIAMHLYIHGPCRAEAIAMAFEIPLEEVLALTNYEWFQHVPMWGVALNSEGTRRVGQ